MSFACSKYFDSQTDVLNVKACMTSNLNPSKMQNMKLIQKKMILDKNKLNIRLFDSLKKEQSRKSIEYSSFINL